MTTINPDDIPAEIAALDDTCPYWLPPSGVRVILAHFWPAIEQHIRYQILGDDLNPSNLVLDAQAYRHLADGISNTMADQNEWDGDDAEEQILLRYVRHLAQTRAEVEQHIREQVAQEIEQATVTVDGGTYPMQTARTVERALTVAAAIARGTETTRSTR